MADLALDRTETTSVEAILRDELTRANRALSGVAPVISHLLESSGQTLVSDATMARLRGMLHDLSRQLSEAVLGVQAAHEIDPFVIDDLADALALNAELLHHLYALAIEGQLTERLGQQSSIDPVLSPLVQELVASDQPDVAELAMAALAAQSRFIQHQRRMSLPIGELPAELFLSALQAMRKSALFDDDEAKHAAKALKKAYDEANGRLALHARLVTSMRSGAIAALNLEHSGFCLFATALASLTGQSREIAVVACHERQAARLALSLRAGGLAAESLERQFGILQPGYLLPEGISTLPQERATALLANCAMAGFGADHGGQGA